MLFFKKEKVDSFKELEGFDMHEELVSIGFEKHTFLIGFSEKISKEVNLYYHRLTPDVRIADKYFQAQIKITENGYKLVEGTSTWFDAFLRDDAIKSTNPEHKEWCIQDSEALINWLGDKNASRYKDTPFYRSHYKPNNTALMMQDFIKEILRIADNDYVVAEKFTALMIANKYADAAELIQVAKIATHTQITEYIKTIKKAEDMKLPVVNHVELFKTVHQNA
jgi:hypothetical protein